MTSSPQSNIIFLTQVNKVLGSLVSLMSREKRCYDEYQGILLWIRQLLLKLFEKTHVSIQRERWNATRSRLSKCWRCLTAILHWLWSEDVSIEASFLRRWASCVTSSSWASNNSCSIARSSSWSSKSMTEKWWILISSNRDFKREARRCAASAVSGLVPTASRREWSLVIVAHTTPLFFLFEERARSSFGHPDSYKLQQQRRPCSFKRRTRAIWDCF